MGNQEDYVDVLDIVNSWIAEKNDEVYLVWEPAETEDDDNSDKHEDGSLVGP